MNPRKTEHSLNDLVAIARDGQAFYTEAAGKVEDIELSVLLRRMARVKADIVGALSVTVQALGGKPDADGTMVGSMRQLYADVRAGLGDTEYAYVSELEESEDRLRKAFDEVFIAVDTPTAVRDAVARLLPEVRACHDVMRNLKRVMKAAA